ncbi:MAG: 50S ribosomal protein L11 methyltransferase [Acidimicrobiales bacterium]
MSRDEIYEHGGYLSDAIKLKAYETALTEVIGPNSSVLDLGAGTGILGLLAARAGARVVYSVDSGSIIEPAKAIARANGLADRMVFIQANSTDLRLEEPVDVVVCDQIGGMAYDAGVLVYFGDARKRLLSPDGILLPSDFRLMAAPVCTPYWEQVVGVWSKPQTDLDLSPMFELAVNTEFRADIEGEEYLGPPAEWASIAADHTDAIAGETRLTIERPGTLNAIAGLFSAQLSPSTTLTNCSMLANSFDRWQNVYPLPHPIEMAEGDTVDVRFDVRPTSYVASWAFTVNSSMAPEPSTGVRGSTIMGMFMTPGDIDTASGSSVVAPSPLLAADRHALDLVDGSRTVDNILDLVWERHGAAFRSREHALVHLHDLLGGHVDPKRRWSASPTA